MSTILSLPKIIPILAKPLKTPFNDPAWSFEMKYDGFRGVLYINGDSGKIFSRQNKALDRFDLLSRDIAQTLNVANAIFDGEVVVMDESNRPIFNHLIFHRGKPQYIAFDLLWLDGQDLRHLPLIERRKFLKRILKNQPPHISPAFAVKGKGIDLFTFMCAHDLEGIIAKRFRDPYIPNVHWYKIKNKQYTQIIGREKFFRKNG